METSRLLNLRWLTGVVLATVCAAQSGPSGGAPPFAILRGTTVILGGKPVAGTQVSVHGLDDGTERNIVERRQQAPFWSPISSSGHYELKASKEGVGASPVSRVDLSPSQNLYTDLTLAEATTPAKPAGFLKRFVNAYANDWKPADPNAPASPAPKFRGYPGAVDGPPFPFSVWPYGGSVVIGQPWTQAGPLMTAIWGGSNGDAWKKSGIQIYGWLNAGANVSTSKGGGYSNFPEAYAERQGFEMDQEVLYVERQPDTVQTDHVDWGFRACPRYTGWITASPRRRVF